MLGCPNLGMDLASLEVLDLQPSDSCHQGLLRAASTNMDDSGPQPCINFSIASLAVRTHLSHSVPSKKSGKLEDASSLYVISGSGCERPEPTPIYGPEQASTRLCR